MTGGPRRLRKDQPLRVVYLGHSASLSGTELALLRMLRSLQDVEPYVILAEDGPLVKRLRASGIPVEVLPLAEGVRALSRDRVDKASLAGLNVVRTGVYVWRLARRLRALEPELVHANTLKAWIYGAPASALARIPVLWHVHDRLSPDYLPPAAIALLRLFARRFAAAILANSAATRATLGNVGLKATVLPSPVEQRPAVHRVHVSDAPFTVGMVGRIAEWKGQDVFIRAMAQAFPDRDARGVVVGAPLFGEDAYSRQLRSLCTQLQVEQMIDFRGFREEVDVELKSLDVLVHTSVLPEPFGQVVVEGMAAGLPVVAAAAGGPLEIIEDGTTGLLYPPGDVQALASILRRLATDPPLRVRLGAAARERANDFRPELVADKLLSVYRDVYATRRRAA